MGDLLKLKEEVLPDLLNLLLLLLHCPEQPVDLPRQFVLLLEAKNPSFCVAIREVRVVVGETERVLLLDWPDCVLYLEVLHNSGKGILLEAFQIIFFCEFL